MGGQASFSWDWGPAFPSAGVWRGAALHVASSARVAAVTWSTALDPELDTFTAVVGAVVEGRGCAGCRVLYSLDLGPGQYSGPLTQAGRRQCRIYLLLISPGSTLST